MIPVSLPDVRASPRPGSAAPGVSSLPSARSAMPVALVPVRVLVVVQMALRALGGLRRFSLAVLLRRHGFEVRRIRAECVPAQVVQFEAGRNITKHEAVRQVVELATVELERRQAVGAVRVTVAVPDPAAVVTHFEGLEDTSPPRSFHVGEREYGGNKRPSFALTPVMRLTQSKRDDVGFAISHKAALGHTGDSIGMIWRWFRW